MDRIAVDLARLQAQGLTLVQLVTALNNSSINVGGQTLNVGEQSAVVRGVGLIRDMDDIRDTMLTQVGGVPVLVRDVADVRVSNAPRLGIVGHDGQSDIVEGIVLMSRGGQSLPTLRFVEAEIDKINAFFLEQEEEFIIHHRELQEDISRALGRRAAGLVTPGQHEAAVAAIRREIVDFHGVMVLLLNYSSINYIGSHMSVTAGTAER